MGQQTGYAPVFKALADDTRLKIVEMLSCGEMCACDILKFFEITQPTLSYHMKMLTECNLVLAKKEGSWMRYCLNDERINMLKSYIDQITTPSDNCICHTCKSNKKDSSCSIRE